MTVYVTKHIFTEGILGFTDAQLCKDSTTVAVRMHHNGTIGLFHGEGREWHTSIEAAKKRARVLRDAKIKGLELQLDKLRALKFE